MDTGIKIIHNIKGFLSEDEGQTLYEYARIVSRSGPCLEIGSYCGKSAFYLGTACRETGNVLFSIDHHHGSEEQQPGEAYFDPAVFDCQPFCIDTFPYFRRTLARAGLENTVVPLVCRSELAARAWNTPLGLVFIDGGHSYPAVKMDYDVWHKHILPGGYLLIHDIFQDSVQGGQAPYDVYRQAVSSGNFKEEPMVGTLGILRKIAGM